MSRHPTVFGIVEEVDREQFDVGAVEALIRVALLVGHGRVHNQGNRPRNLPRSVYLGDGVRLIDVIEMDIYNAWDKLHKLAAVGAGRALGTRDQSLSRNQLFFERKELLDKRVARPSGIPHLLQSGGGFNSTQILGLHQICNDECGCTGDAASTMHNNALARTDHSANIRVYRPEILFCVSCIRLVQQFNSQHQDVRTVETGFCRALVVCCTCIHYQTHRWRDLSFGECIRLLNLLIFSDV